MRPLAGAVGIGLLACRRCAAVACLHHQLKELWEEVNKLHSIGNDKKKVDQTFPKTLEIEDLEPPAALKEEQEHIVHIELGNRDSQDGDGWNL